MSDIESRDIAHVFQQIKYEADLRRDALHQKCASFIEKCHSDNAKWTSKDATQKDNDYDTSIYEDVYGGSPVKVRNVFNGNFPYLK